MKLFFIILNLIAVFENKVPKKRKLEDTLVITENNTKCVENAQSTVEMKNCLTNLNIKNEKDAHGLIKTICLNNLNNIKSQLQTNKIMITNKMSNVFLNLENVLNNQNLDLKNYNDLLIKYKSQINTNKVIINGLNKIQKYLYKVIIIKEVFTENELHKYNKIKNEFSNDLEKTQRKNEIDIKNSNENMHKKILKHKESIEKMMSKAYILDKNKKRKEEKLKNNTNDLILKNSKKNSKLQTINHINTNEIEFNKVLKDFKEKNKNKKIAKKKIVLNKKGSKTDEKNKSHLEKNTKKKVENKNNIILITSILSILFLFN